MSAYRQEDLEAVHTRGLLRDWAGDGLITPAQREQLEQEVVCELRSTNIFLRLVLFFFTLTIVGAAAGLLFLLFLRQAPSAIVGVVLLVLAALVYWAAEQAAGQARLYRHGIEEALGCGAVLLLCVGLLNVLPGEAEFLMPAAGAGASWWLWRRFGFWYAVPAAMLLADWVAGYWTQSPGAQHLAAAAIYAAGLLAVGRARKQALAEAFLWFGVYCAVNIPLSSLSLFRPSMSGAAALPQALYWFTWVLTWCLPPLILWRGVQEKVREIIAAGLITAILTLATNKAYLGWERNTWDPMLLGLLLAGTALWLRRWLDGGPGGVRAGFTARRLSGKDQALLDAGGTALGLAAPALTAVPAPAAPNDAPRFGGGQSGGGGASSDF